MLRLAPFAIVSVSLATLSGPPSSLEPQAERGVVQIVHSHQRAAACLEKTDPKTKTLSCTPELRPADGSGTIRLIPVVAAPGTDKREAMQLTLSRAGTAPPVQLEVGPWDVDWVEGGRRGRLSVSAGPTTRVRLSTTSGACSERQKRCTLAAQTVTRKLEVQVVP